jgi:thiol:disulfide interchange protein DsbG
MKKAYVFIIAVIFIIAVLFEFIYRDHDVHSKITDPALALVLKQTKDLVVVEKQFRAIDNLEGFLVHFKNSPTNQAIIYADKQGRYMLMGDIVTPEGKNITLEQSHNLIHDPLINEAYYNLKDTHWIYQGKKNAKHLISVLIDPNSPLFPLQYNRLITYIDQGDLAVRWILVSYLKPFGDKHAAAILQAKDPINALLINEKDYNFKTQTGGISPAKAISPKTEKKLEDNWNFMQKYKFSGTPVIFMQTKAGKIYVITGFLMDEMLENVIDSLKSPEQIAD